MIQYCKITVCLTKITIRVHEIFIFKQFIRKFSSKPWRYFLWLITYLFCLKLFNLTKEKIHFFHTFSYLQNFLEATVQFLFWKGKWLFWSWNQRNRNKCTSSDFFFFWNSALVIWNKLYSTKDTSPRDLCICNDFDSAYCTVYLHRR